MNKFIYFAIIAISLVAAYSFANPKVDFKLDDADGIQFSQGNFKSLIHQAQKQKKLIFMDVYATWCGPCKRLKAKTFSNHDVGKYFNANFLNIAIDGESEEGLELAKMYGVRAYPTLLFINEQGEIVKRVAGYYDADDLIDLAKTVVK